MKVKAKTSASDGTTRVSALQRLSKPNSMTNSVHQRISASTTPVVTDARQLLSNRNKPVFDARQLLSRQGSKTQTTSLMNQRDIDPEDDEEEDDEPKTMVLQRSNIGRLTTGTLNRLSDKKKNPFVSTEPISFTKTISNTSYDRPSQTTTSVDQKFVISFPNDQFRKRARSPSPTPPSIIKRSSNVSSTSRISNRRDSDGPPKKHQSLSTISKGPLKQASTSVRPKSSSATIADEATILITNLQSSVTEDDVIELFGEIGHINDIKTLSRGCIQVIYGKAEHAQQAVANYHNRLLDGQLMYVSLQQPSYSTKSSKKTSSSSSTTTTINDEESSKKYSIDPSFIRQALFDPSNNTKNPVQFQVKL